MSKRGLGRGLQSLLPQTGVQEVVDLPLSVVELDPDQPRKVVKEEEIEELANSIREHGVLQPVLVRPHPLKPGTYLVIAGERRYRASVLAEKETIPVVIHKVDEKAALAIALIENLQRQDLNPIEEAMAYQRLMEEFSLTQEGVAEEVGKSRSYVANMIRLLKLSQKAKDALVDGGISMGHAKVLLSLPNDKQDVWCEKVVEKGLTVRELERLLALERAREKGKTRPEPPPTLKDLEKRLRSRYKGVRFTVGKKGYKMIMPFSSVEEIEKFFQRLELEEE
jgi:ParB family chromosome partitioning protein